MTQQILFGGVATWFGRGVNILLGLLLMPMLFRHLSKQELGVWLLLGQSWAALGILDLGLGVIFTRRIAFATLASNEMRESSRTCVSELPDLIATGRITYTWLAGLGLVISFIVGMIYLREIKLPCGFVGQVWIAWGVLCLSQALGTWAAVWTCLLQGLGFVGWDTLIASAMNCLTLLLQILVVVFGGGIVSLAMIAAVGSLIQRLLIRQFIRKRRRALRLNEGRWRGKLLREMVSPALQAWLTSVGCLLIGNTDQWFIVAYAGTNALPAYRAAFLLVINLHLLAGVFSGASPVFVSQLWQAGNLEAIRSILRRNARIGLWSMACGAGAILALGPTLFHWWLGPGNFVGYPILTIFLVMFVLEHHANVFSTCGRATNDEAYAACSLGTGLLKLVLAWLLTARFGLFGLAASTLIAQLAWSDWFMVFRSARRLRVDFTDHLKAVLLPCCLLFFAALGFGMVLSHLLRTLTPVCSVLSVSGAAMLLLLAALWRLALSPPERAQLLRKPRWRAALPKLFQPQMSSHEHR